MYCAVHGHLIILPISVVMLSGQFATNRRSVVATQQVMKELKCLPDKWSSADAAPAAAHMVRHGPNHTTGKQGKQAKPQWQPIDKEVCGRFGVVPFGGIESYLTNVATLHLAGKAIESHSNAENESNWHDDNWQSLENLHCCATVLSLSGLPLRSIIIALIMTTNPSTEIVPTAELPQPTMKAAFPTLLFLSYWQQIKFHVTGHSLA